MTDKHRPRFVVPSQGGRPRGARAGDVWGDAAPQQTQQQPQQPQQPDGRFRALFENAPLGVALCDLDGRFAEVNPSLRDLLAGTGIDPDGGGLADLARHHPEGSDEATAWRGELADVRAGRIPVARAELAVAPPDGAPRWLQATTAIVALGGRHYLLSHVEDTTARRLAELAGLSTGILLADRLAAASTRDLATGLHTGVLTVAVEDGEGMPALLAAVSERLVGLLRAGDTVAPLDGEAFGVIAPAVPDESALGVLVDRIVDALDAVLDDERFGLCAAVRVGAVLARPGEGLVDALRRTGQTPVHVQHVRAGPVDVRETDLRETDLRETDLRETALRETALRETALCETDVSGGEVRDGDVHERPV